MQLVEIKKLAKTMGISPGKMKKAELIHAIQSKEGNLVCYQTGQVTCDQYSCSWRSDCMSKDSGQKELGKKESYRDKIKAELGEFNLKLNNLKKNARKMMGKAKDEALADIQKLEEKSEKEIKEKLHDLSEVGDDAWHSVKKGIDSSWDELKKGAQKVMSKFK